MSFTADSEAMPPCAMARSWREGAAPALRQQITFAFTENINASCFQQGYAGLFRLLYALKTPTRVRGRAGQDSSLAGSQPWQFSRPQHIEPVQHDG